MKKTINAFIYPTPAEFDRQAGARRPSLTSAMLDEIYEKLKESSVPWQFDPNRHISQDDTEAHVPDDRRESMNDIFARAIEEELGFPTGSLCVVDGQGDTPIDLGYRYAGTRTGRFVPHSPNEFVWQSHDGTKYNLSEMATPHILYALRMIFNHTVPPAFRVLRPGETMKRYGDVAHWDVDYKRRAVDAFTAELERRDDLDGIFKDQYEDMRANATALSRLGILP